MTKELVPIGGRQRAAFAQREAHGKLRLLAVGIDLYQPASGFQNLKTCANDAMAIQGCFADVHQLNADKEQLHLLTSKGNPVSRGLIIGKLRELAQTAEASNRILFFYSGHGHRIGDKFFLVPQDAYSDSDEKALISIEEVIAILNGSNAKQKIIVLDACLSGPDASHIKLLPARYSRKFLIDYLEKTNGVVILSSSRADQSSTTQSPNPKLSRMTHDALRNGRAKRRS